MVNCLVELIAQQDIYYKGYIYKRGSFYFATYNSEKNTFDVDGGLSYGPEDLEKNLLFKPGSSRDSSVLEKKLLGEKKASSNSSQVYVPVSSLGEKFESERVSVGANFDSDLFSHLVADHIPGFFLIEDKHIKNVFIELSCSEASDSVFVYYDSIKDLLNNIGHYRKKRKCYLRVSFGSREGSEPSSKNSIPCRTKVTVDGLVYN